MMIPILTALAVALYVAAAILLARPLLGGGEPLRGPGTTLATLAVLAHLAILFGMHRGALDLHFFAALSLVACLVAALTLIVDRTRPVAALGILVFPLAALLLGIDVFLAPPTLPQAMDWQIKLHVTVALVAFAIRSIAAVLAILLAVQESALRHRRFGRWQQALPPLTLTESLLFRLIAVGFVMLTLTLITGGLFVDNLFGQHLMHKTVLSIAAWVVFGVLLTGRWLRGWRGRSAVNLTLIGMAILLLAFFGSKFVLEVVLNRTH